MAHYVDGFVIPLPEKNVGDYRCEAHALRRVQDHRRSLSWLSIHSGKSAAHAVLNWDDMGGIDDRLRQSGFTEDCRLDIE